MTLDGTDVSAEDGESLDLDDSDPADVSRWSNRRVFGAYLDRKKRSQSHSTYVTRRTAIRRLHHWLEVRGEHAVTDMTAERSRRFLQSHEDAGYAAATVRSASASVKDCFNILTDSYGIDPTDWTNSGHPADFSNGDISATSGQSLKQQHSGRTREYLTRDEVDALAENAPEPTVRNRLLIQMTFETGWRRGTVASIRFENLDTDEQIVSAYSQKSDETVTAAYSSEVADMLNAYLNLGLRKSAPAARESEYLFVGYNCDHIQGESINRIVGEAAENAGLQETVGRDAAGNEKVLVTAHVLRHSHAVWLLEKGKSVEFVRDKLGHADISTTQTYAEVDESRRKDEMRDLLN